MKIFLTLLIALFLSGCATIGQQGDDEGRFLSRLQQLTSADLKAALDSAISHDDKLSVPCWSYLSQAVTQQAPKTDVVGIASAYQRLRNLRRGVLGGISDELRLACAAMVQDSRDFALRFGSAFGSGGIATIP